jgi:membrane-bound lytic murein transglycosylase D
MALASYNCGAGALNNAIKRARSENYWAIAKYLPKETRNFVPAFLGAAYIGNFYHLHGIEPNYPSLDMQVTEAVKVYERLDFTTIAAVTALPVSVIEQLNPAFKRSYVPENTEGHDIIIPRRTASALIEYLDARRPDSPRSKDMPQVLPAIPDSASYKPNELYFRSIYVVAEGDKIGDLADIFNVLPYNLKVWNKLTSYQLRKGQELTIWFPNEFHRFLPKEERIEVVPIAAAPANEPVVEQAPDEEVFERDALPLPTEIPTSFRPAGKVGSTKEVLLKTTTIAPPAAASTPKMKATVEKIVGPIKDIKIQLPKRKDKPAAAPAEAKKKTAAPKPSKQPWEANGHGLN